MDQFDPQNYFANRVNPLAGKMDELIKARLEKAQAIQQSVVRDTAELAAAREDWDKSMAGRLGFEMGSTTGNIANTAVATAAEGADAVAAVAGGVFDAQKAALDQHIPDRAKVARLRQLAGNATEEDLKVLAAPAGHEGMPVYANPMLREQLRTGNYETNQQRIEAAEKARDRSQAVRKVLNLDDQVAKDQLTGQKASGLARRAVGDSAVSLAKGVVGLGESVVGVGDIATLGLSGKGLEALGYDPKSTHKILDSYYSPEQQLANKKVQDAEGFLNTLEAGLDNPSIISQGLIQSLPAMLGGGAIGKELLMQYPKVMALVGKSPALAAIAEKLPALTPGAASAVGEGVTMAGNAAENIRQDNEDKRLTLKQALLATGIGVGGAATAMVGNKLAHKLGVGDIDESVVRGKLKATDHPVVGGVVSGALEGGEELTQSAQEQVLKNVAQGKPWDEGVGNASAVGVLTGSPMGMVGGMGHSAGAKAQDEANKEKEVADQKQAIKTGDIDKMVDPQSKYYSPDRAIAALYGNSQLEGTTADAKQANFERATSVAADVHAQHDTLVEQLAAAKAALADLDPTDKASVASHTELVQALEEEIGHSNELIKNVEDRLRVFSQEMQAKTVDAASELATINGGDPVAAQAAADRMINLAMATPENLDHGTAAALADNESLTETQRNFFRKFSDSQVAEHLMKDDSDVSHEIFNGGHKYVGLNTYRSNMAAALASNNQKAAQRHLKQLSAFAGDHEAKATAATNAYQQFEATGKPVQIRSDGKRGWFVHTGPLLSESALRAEGGFQVDARSRNVVPQMVKESTAINSAMETLQAAYDTKFSPKRESQDVKNVSSTDGKQVSEKRSTQEASNEAGARQGSGDAGERAAESAVQRGQAGDSTQASQATGVTEEATASTVVSTEQAEGQTQSNDQSTTAEDAQTSEVPVTAPETAAEHTGLTVLATQKSDDVLPAGTKLGAVYTTINKVVAFLTQTKARIEKDSDIAKDRPLVSVANMLSRWNAGQVVPTDFFPDGLLESEIGALTTFQKFANEWSPLIRQNLTKGGIANLKGNKPNPEFLYEDPLQDFFNEDGTIDENVVTAIAYGAYSWLVDSMNGPALKIDEDILRMHGVQGDDVTVSPEGRRKLSTLVMFKDNAAGSIGRHVVDALGLKVNSKAPADYMNKLQTAFGLQALTLLAQGETNMIDMETLSGEELNKLMPGIDIKPTGQTKGRIDKNGNKIEARDTYPTLTYVKIRRDRNFQLPADGKSIRDASVQSHGVLERMFSSEHNAAYASWAPIKFSQQQAKRTDQKISEKQRRILEKAQATPHRIIPAMWDALSVLGDDVILKAAGWTEYDEQRIQKSNRESVMAKNMGLEDQLSGMKALVQDAIDNSPEKEQQPFYAALEVWKNFRVGVATRNMNLQSSKIHRFMFFRPEWESKIKFDDAKAMEQFKVSVAQAFGVKVDQQNNQATIQKFDAMVAADNGRINELALALANALEDPTKEVLTSGQKQDIAEFTAGAEGMQSLQALVAWGKYLAADKAKAGEVTVHMLVGVDGKTNGPILTYLALGATESVDDLFTQLNRGGMFRQNDGVDNYNHWYERADSLDLYEDLAHKILSGIESSKDLAAIYTFTKQLIDGDKVTSAGRNLAKTPLTSFIFGSSIDKSIENMQYTFVQSVIDRIEAVANGTDKRTTRVELIRSLNQLLDAKVSENTSIDALMNHEFTAEEKAALMAKFYEQIGSRVEETMKFYFNTYLERRNDINSTIQSSFNIYNAVYKDLRAKEMERLMDEGEIAFTEKEGKRVPIHDLTVAQEKALRAKVQDILPLANTAYTVGTDQLDAGLYMAKTRAGVSSEEHNKVKVQLGRLIPSGDNWRTNHITGRAMQTTEQSPGVAGLPYFMHSLDSAVMHESLEDTDTLNVHDEAGNGVNNVIRTAQSINKSTFDNMLAFSPATEAFNMLARIVENTVKMIEAGDVSPESLAEVGASLRAKLPFKMRNKVSDAQLPALAIELANNAQFNANRIRLEGLSQMTAIDQYTWEGGQYQVTKQDRDKAKEALDRLLQTKQVNPELMAAADKLGAALASTRVKAEPVANEQDTTNTNLFGPVGKSAIASDPALVAFFRGKPERTAKEVMDFLAKSGKLNAVNAKILQLLARTVSPSMRVMLVTPKTQPDQVRALSNGPARGWFVEQNGTKEVYVLSPEFKYSGLTAETMLHELVHAAVAATIDAPTAAAKELINELEQLREKAKAFAEANNLSGFEAALDNVQEFVAWGMTNFEFQRDVLAKIQMESQTQGNALVTGMKKFIDTLAKLLFKKPDENLTNGLNVLVGNVSGLFYQAALADGKVGTDANLNLAMAVNRAVDAYTTLDIHQALDNGTVEPQFQQHLANLLTGIVDRLHGPFGAFAAQMRKTEAGNPLAVWLKAMETGHAPFGSEIVASGFAGSAQEDFAMQQVEATVKAALDGSEATTKQVYRELYKLYDEMRAKLKPSDFASQADYDFVFKIEANGNRSDYLARFAALGLASQKFNALLKVATDADTRGIGEGNSIMERLANIFEKILAFFNEKLTHTFGGQQADEKLTTLVEQLVDIEAKKRELIKLQAMQRNPVADVEKTVKALVETGREKLSELAGSQVVRKSSLGVVRLTGTLVRLSTLGVVDKYLDDIRKFYDTQMKERHGLGISLLNELKGPIQKFEELLRARKHQEQRRKTIITQKSKQALQMFANKGQDLSEKARSSVTKALLRTGAHTLLGTFDVKQIEQLLSNRVELTKQIATFTQQLPAAVRDRYLEQINALGYFNVTGKSRTPVLMLNAHLISRLAGTQFAHLISESEAAAAEDTIKTLVTLYGLKYLDNGVRLQAVEVMRTENSRTDDGNGVEFVLALHKHLEQVSLETLFNNNPALMVHGYTPEILNPHTAFEVATEERGRALMEQGWQMGAMVTNDSRDPTAQAKHIYVQRDGGLAPWLSGIVSMSGLHTKGTTLHNGYLNPRNEQGLENAQLQATITTNKLDQIKRVVDPTRDLRNDEANNLVPVFNESGQIANWRYMMADQTKDDLLERDSRFDQVMGVLAGSVFDKQTSEEVNSELIQALRDQFEEEYATQKDSYLEVGPDSSDPKLREIYALLSDGTRSTIRSIWGRKGMMVRTDVLDIVFGYRKYSLSEAFTKNPSMRNDFERFTLETLEAVLVRYGRTPDQAANHIKKIGYRIAKGERMWQEIVREIKDIVVVKNVSTLVGNIYSNFSFLYAAGVPWKDILHHHIVAIKGTLSYHADAERLAELETQLATGFVQGNRSEIEREVIRLRDLIDRNPVKKLLDAGLMPTIVEDVSQDDDIYSYKSMLGRKAEQYTSKMNPKVVEAARFVYMAHDTKLYQLLSQATQMSDFVARYTLFQHLISRQEDPMSEKDAMFEASESFINYDIPMHKALQYADDMGIVPFTKYFLRIQRVLVKAFRKNPARILTMGLLDKYMSLGPIVLDSSFAHHLGNNPLYGGALRFPETLDELATVKAAFALVK